MLQKKLYNFGNQIHMYMFSQNKECFKNKTVKNYNVWKKKSGNKSHKKVGLFSKTFLRNRFRL